MHGWESNFGMAERTPDIIFRVETAILSCRKNSATREGPDKFWEVFCSSVRGVFYEPPSFILFKAPIKIKSAFSQPV